MATVVRRRALVNPARRRRKMSPKQIRYFGTPAQKAALRRKRSNAGPFSRRKTKKRLKSWTERMRSRGISIPRSFASRTVKRYSRKNSAHRKRTRRARRRNVSAIVTAGLPYLNPVRKRRKTTMARVHRKYRRRRSNASTRPRRRRYSTHFAHHRRHRRRNQINPAFSHRRRRRSYRSNPRRRRNLGRRGGASVTSSLMKGVYVVGGAVGSRWLTQVVLGTGNTGIMGYAGNAIATLALGWAGGKFLGRGSGPWIVAGGAAGLILRVIQDQTPLGKYFNLSGIDSGMGAIIPANFVYPPIYTGNNAMARIPAGFGPGPAPVAAGAVVRGAGMGGPVGRGLYSTGGGRGFYRPA